MGVNGFLKYPVEKVLLDYNPSHKSPSSVQTIPEYIYK
jgi:hypothetical protein